MPLLNHLPWGGRGGLITYLFSLTHVCQAPIAGSQYVRTYVRLGIGMALFGWEPVPLGIRIGMPCTATLLESCSLRMPNPKVTQPYAYKNSKSCPFFLLGAPFSLDAHRPKGSHEHLSHTAPAMGTFCAWRCSMPDKGDPGHHCQSGQHSRHA